MSQKKIKENKEAVADKMKLLLLDNRPTQAQTLKEALENWQWSHDETEKRQKILDELLKEEL